MNKNILFILPIASMALTSCGQEIVEEIKVESIVLNQTSLELYYKESATLEATCFPNEAVDKTIVWSTSDPTICNVSGGVLIPYKAGEVVITCLNPTSGVSSSCAVKVIDNVEKYLTRTNQSAVADKNFTKGFTLFTPHQSPAQAEKDLNYEQGENVKPYWKMSQWWSPFNFKDSTYTNVDGIHKYENENRSLEVDTSTGKVSIALDASKEYQYYEDTPEEDIDPKLLHRGWSHYLLEQNFPKDTYISLSEAYSEGKQVRVMFDVTIDEAVRTKAGVGSDCAQLLFYLNLANRKQEGQSDEEYGPDRSLIWFGVPIYDTRYDFTTEYKQYDSGFAGATNRLIYSLSSKGYMGATKPEIGKTYHVDIDVLEYIHDAYIYALQNGLDSIYKWDNLYVTYLNVGWEIPGGYKVASTFQNIDVYCVG